MPTRNFYSILGVPEDADQPTIRRAYRRLVFSAHPDTGESRDLVRFRGIQEAYRVLSDEQQRRAYDREFRHRPRAAQPMQPGAPIDPMSRSTCPFRIGAHGTSSTSNLASHSAEQ